MADELISRSKEGLVISLSELENGKLRVVVDEVIADGCEWPQRWASRLLLTHRDFEPQALLDNQLTQQELADLSELILAYLGAKHRS